VVSDFSLACRADVGFQRVFLSTCCFCDSEAFEDLDSELGQARGKVSFGPVKLILDHMVSFPSVFGDAILDAFERDLIHSAQEFVERYDIHLVGADRQASDSTLVATQPVVELGPEWDGCCHSAFYHVDVDIQIPAGSDVEFLVVPITKVGSRLPGQLVKGQDCCTVAVKGNATFEISGDLAEAQSNLTIFRTAIRSTIADIAGVSEKFVEVSLSFSSRRLQESSYFRVFAIFTVIVPVSAQWPSVVDRLSQVILANVTAMVGDRLAAVGVDLTIRTLAFSASLWEAMPVPLAEEQVSAVAASTTRLVILVVIITMLVLSVMFLVCSRCVSKGKGPPPPPLEQHAPQLSERPVEHAPQLPGHAAPQYTHIVLELDDNFQQKLYPDGQGREPSPRRARQHSRGTQNLLHMLGGSTSTATNAGTSAKARQPEASSWSGLTCCFQDDMLAEDAVERLDIFTERYEEQQGFGPKSPRT